MNRALWLLMGLQMRGWLRSLGRNLRTLKKALLVTVGLGVVVLWLIAVSTAPRHEAAMDPQALKDHGPSVFVAYCVLTVLLSRGERAFYFSPGEVNFLFAGPFTRRQLLIYKIVVSALIGVPTALFLTLLLHVHARWVIAAFVGLYLAYLFMQLFAIAVSLIGITVGTQAYTRGRKVLLLAIGALAAVLLFRDSQQGGGGGLVGVFTRLEGSPVWQTVTTPLVWFVETFLVEPGDWLGLAKWGGLSLGVTGLFVLLVLLLDAQYLESVSTTSERLYKQIQKFRRGEAVSLNWSGSGTARWGLPLPWWGGVGPVAWRQATTAVRSLGRLALVLLILVPVMLGPMFAKEQQGDTTSALLFINGWLLWLSLLLTTLVPFDFRSDLDRMDLLKTLPLPAWRVVLGQLLTPAMLLGVLQALSLLAFWAFVRLEGWAILWGLAFTIPLNLLLCGLDNLLFLWFPSRIRTAGPGDFQALGRQVLIMMTKMLVLGTVAAVSGGLGLLAGWLSGYHLHVGLAVGWVFLSAFAAGLVPLVALAFRQFDVARDMPA